MTAANENNSAAKVRREAAEALTKFLERTADAIDAEQIELAEKFPSMSSLPKPIDVDPDVISDFTMSEAYRQAVEDYVAGRSEQNLLVAVLRLLRGVIPNLFGGI